MANEKPLGDYVKEEGCVELSLEWLLTALESVLANQDDEGPPPRGGGSLKFIRVEFESYERRRI